MDNRSAHSVQRASRCQAPDGFRGLLTAVLHRPTIEFVIVICLRDTDGDRYTLRRSSRNNCIMPEFFNVLAPDIALQSLLERLPPPVEAETVPTHQALGRVTAAAILAPEHLPAFPRSTMDG